MSFVNKCLLAALAAFIGFQWKLGKGKYVGAVHQYKRVSRPARPTRDDDESAGAGAGSGVSVGSVTRAIWVYQERLKILDSSVNEHLGTSVALHGNAAIFGVHDIAVGGKVGYTGPYVFTRSSEGAPFSQQQRLSLDWHEPASATSTSADAADAAGADSRGNYDDDGYGSHNGDFSVSMWGDTALIGNYNSKHCEHIFAVLSIIPYHNITHKIILTRNLYSFSRWACPSICLRSCPRGRHLVAAADAEPRHRSGDKCGLQLRGGD